MENSSVGTSVKTDVSFKHLQTELARIDVLIRREVRRWQLAGQDPADAFKGLHLTDADAERLLDSSFGASWAQSVELPSDEALFFSQAEATVSQQLQQLLEFTQQNDQITRLQYLAAVFNLDQFEIDTLLICLAPALDLRYERLYAYLQDDITRKQPSINLILGLLGPLGSGRLSLLPYFSNESALFKNNLLEKVTDINIVGSTSLLNQLLSPDMAVVNWLLGDYQSHATLGSYAQLSWPADAVVDAILVNYVDINKETTESLTEQSLIVFYGPDSDGQLSAARQLVFQLGRLLLTVDLVQITKGDVSPLDAVKLALRDARLTSAIPILTGWDVCFENDTVSPQLLNEVYEHPDIVIISGEKKWQAKTVNWSRTLLWFEFPIPSYSHRYALWEHYLEQISIAEEINITGLASQFALTTRQIQNVVVAARDKADQQGSLVTNDTLFAMARDYSNPRLASLARKIVPRYQWDDIILPADQLTIMHEIVSTVLGRPLVLEEWGVGEKLASSNGVTVLFAGPPGTGKTMAAEIIARELGLDLYKIDLSTIISKYIGETEKNLERIFGEAQSSNAILFFDEADAIFGKRSEVKDAHDRYANIEVSYLLQRMEGYDGVTILATNLRANLDEAFTRRLQFAVDFPFPEQEERLQIWKTLFPPNVPRQSNLDFELLADRFKLTGGNIRNVIVSAAYLAAADGGTVTMEHLMHGTRRELQKMGRLINEANLKLK